MLVMLIIKVYSISWFILLIFSSDKVSGKCTQYMIIKITKLTWGIKSILNPTVEIY